MDRKRRIEMLANGLVIGAVPVKVMDFVRTDLREDHQVSWLTIGIIVCLIAAVATAVRRLRD